MKLVEKNLLKCKPLESEQQIFEVWEKEIRVVREIRSKLERREEGTRENATRGGRSGHTNSTGSELNPQQEWESLVKGTIRQVIGLLERGYRQTTEESGLRQSGRKQSMLMEINMLLDLVIFPQLSVEYLKTPFGRYLDELHGHTPKVLLRLINRKLVLINKRYYAC